MVSTNIAITQTKKWIHEVIIGCNFCPFAAPVLKAGRIAYEVNEKANIKIALEVLALAFVQLDKEETTETILLIFPDSFGSFDDYLTLVDLSETLLADAGYEGIYQIASFHPEYLFAGSRGDDPANFTNRSPYPMLHILREESVSRAVDAFPGTEKIPERNIKYAQQKGIEHMQQLWQACFTIE